MEDHTKNVEIMVSAVGSFRRVSSELHEKQQHGNDIVDWDGSEDAANPRNWNPRTKMVHVMLVSAFTFYS